MNGKLRRVFQLIKFLRYSVTMDFLESQNQQVRYASVTAATVLEKKLSEETGMSLVVGWSVAITK